MTKALDDKYSYQIDEHNVVHLFRRGEDWQEDLTNPLISAILKIEILEKENVELKERVKTLTIHDTNAVLSGLEMKVLKESHRDRANKTQEQLTKAKELLSQLVNIEYAVNIPKDKIISLRVKAEQFLKE